jgi:glycerol-3-phosphate dehydrogenase
MARSVDDVLSRRTRARLLARDASAAAADDVADLIAPVLGLSEQEAGEQVQAYRDAVEAERTQADLPVTPLDGLLNA